jgi:hypothetical protein
MFRCANHGHASSLFVQEAWPHTNICFSTSILINFSPASLLQPFASTPASATTPASQASLPASASPRIMIFAAPPARIAPPFSNRFLASLGSPSASARPPGSLRSKPGLASNPALRLLPLLDRSRIYSEEHHAPSFPDAPSLTLARITATDGATSSNP